MKPKERRDILTTPKGLVKCVSIYGYYKTAIIGELPHTYKVVTKVNNHTAKLWLEYHNSIVIEEREPFIKMRKYITSKGKERTFPELPDKVNWFIMIGNYRRDQDELRKSIILNTPNL